MRAQSVDSLHIIGGFSLGQLLIQFVNEGGNEAIAEYLSTHDQPLLHIEGHVDESPLKFVLQTVFEIRGLPVAPIPLARIFINLVQLANLLQIVHFQVNSVHRKTLPVLCEGLFKRSAVGFVVNGRRDFSQIHDAGNHRVNSFRF